MAVQGLFYIHIQVSDLARSKAFYGDALGWGLETDEAEVAGFRFGSGYLVISQVQRPADRRPWGLEVCVQVDDLEAQHARLTQGGAGPGPIEAHPWGERNFSFLDPDGYAWRYGQPVG
ncbi:MAG TPA: VOC family protein [Phenylobacterium sp.]|nr:VOC family protein [Phenylobacterium sp.]